MNDKEIIEEVRKNMNCDFNEKTIIALGKALAMKDAEHLEFLKKQNIIGIEDMFSNFRKDNCGVLKGNDILSHPKGWSILTEKN